jgi:hypothetical protein
MSGRFHLTRRVTGGGSEVVTETFFPQRKSGSVFAWLVRLEPGGLATLLTPCLADGLGELDTREPPPDEYKVAAEDAVTLTPSASSASFRTSFVHPMPFQDGLRFIGNVTASGAFSLVVSIWGEEE